MDPKRQHPRFAHEATLAIHANGAVYRGKSTNLSRGGLCADLSGFLAIGTDVIVDIQLVFDHDFKSEPLQVQARVVWCTTVDGERQVGLSFQRLRPEQTEFLTLFLRYLDHSTRDRIRTHYNVDDRFS